MCKSGIFEGVGIMERLLSEEKRKELFKKREYYSKNPDEAKKEYAKKRTDNFVPLGKPKKTK